MGGIAGIGGIGGIGGTGVTGGTGDNMTVWMGQISESLQTLHYKVDHIPSSSSSSSVTRHKGESHPGPEDGVIRGQELTTGLHV